MKIVLAKQKEFFKWYKN